MTQTMNDPYKAEFGQWWETNNHRVFHTGIPGAYPFIDTDGRFWSAAYLANDDYIHLPNCTGWDWVEPAPKPLPDPGEGWRLLRKEPEPEPVEKGDQYLESNGEWRPSVNWKHRLPQEHRNFYRRRIAPTYRPFAGAAEFAPNRERWMRRVAKPGDNYRRKVYSYNDRVVDGMSYETLLQYYVWDDDGKPCGVEVTP